MDTKVLDPRERMPIQWEAPDEVVPESVELSLDSGLTWRPFAWNGLTWTALVQGPLAPFEPGVAVVAEGLTSTLVRYTVSGGLVRVADGGILLVKSQCQDWPVDWSCRGGVGDEDPALIYRAERLAISTLRALTLNRVGGCPITVRPCSGSCWEAPSHRRDASPFYPHQNAQGRWVNGCGCGSRCHCGPAMDSLLLAAPVGRVDEVWVKGETLDPSAYRLEGDRLVRLDGGRWPGCQDFTQDANGLDAFSVTYLNAYPVDEVGAYAAGLLADEYLSACSGKDCSLPSGVVQIVRQGVTMTMAEDLFSQGLTGNAVVDSFTARFNPHRLRTKPTVWSPDLQVL